MAQVTRKLPTWTQLRDALIDSPLPDLSPRSRVGRRRLPTRSDPNADPQIDDSSSDGAGHPPTAQARIRLFPGAAPDCSTTTSTPTDVLGMKRARTLATGSVTSGAKQRLANVTLWRDTHGWCTYCRMIWTVLELKRIPYRVKTVPLHSYGDKPASYLEDIDPRGTVPVLEIQYYEICHEDISNRTKQGRLPNDEQETLRTWIFGPGSSVEEMLWELEDGELFEAFAEPALLPPSDVARDRAWSLLKLKQCLWARDQDWVRTNKDGDEVWGEKGVKGKSGKKGGKDTKGKGKGKASSSSTCFFESEFFTALGWAEQELASCSCASEDGPWFFGAQLTIVDICFSSVIERAFATASYFKGVRLPEKYPHLAQWLSELGFLPTYQACSSDLHTHAHIHSGPLGRWGPCVLELEGCECRQEVDALSLFSEPSEVIGRQALALPSAEVDVLRVFSQPISEELTSSRRQSSTTQSFAKRDLNAGDDRWEHFWLQNFWIDCLEAAFALVKHHARVVHSASQGVHAHMRERGYINGDWSEELMTSAADCAYRSVAAALIRFGKCFSARATSDSAKSRETLGSGLRKALEEAMKEAAILIPTSKVSAEDCQTHGDDGQHIALLLVPVLLRFTADRVSVPRDMGARAARVLRGSLAFVADSLAGVAPEERAGEGTRAGITVPSRVPIPMWDRRDQDPAKFYAI